MTRVHYMEVSGLRRSKRVSDAGHSAGRLGPCSDSDYSRAPVPARFDAANCNADVVVAVRVAARINHLRGRRKHTVTIVAI